MANRADCPQCTGHFLPIKRQAGRVRKTITRQVGRQVEKDHHQAGRRERRVLRVDGWMTGRVDG